MAKLLIRNPQHWIRVDETTAQIELRKDVDEESFHLHQNKSPIDIDRHQILIMEDDNF